MVKIPYNFDNKTNFSMVPKSSENVVYAGETVDVSGTTVTVGTRQNGVVEANYATNVDGAQVKLIAYVADENRSGTDPAASSFDCGSVNPVQSSLCGEAKYSSGTLKVDNPDKGQVFNDTTKILGETFDGSYNVFDARAGDWFCMSLGVYPAKSGTDDEDGDKNLSASGNDKWYVYTPTCYQIAKKPSFQIWGGGLYSAGEISTFVSEKNNIYGIGSVGMKTFGSWVEQNATAKGTITNFASGAALGKNKTQGDKVGYGLSSSLSEFCKYMVPLTFANYLSNSTNPCSNGSVGQSDINPITSNVKALVDYWGSVTENSSCSNVGGISGKMAASGNAEKDICISDVNGDVTIGASGVGWSQTRIVKANNVTIDGYIEYQNDGFDRLSEIPKVIIYAKNDIKISCDVKRVDAILIAEKTIYSCNEYSGSGTVSGTDEDTIRSKQLVVNGAMIANRLELGRTYGNTMGTESNDPQPNLANPKIGSETPAEIINYDVSILLWGESMAGAEESDTLTVTYQHELAPRY